MQGSFDPYCQWLELPPGPRPPSPYELLGLRPGESDPQAIARAADAMLIKVRKIRPGPLLAQWSRLLEELEAAKAALLDAAKKTPSSVAAPAQVVPPVQVRLTAGHAIPSDPSARPASPASENESLWRSWLMTGLLVFAGTTLGGWVATLWVPRPTTAKDKDEAAASAPKAAKPRSPAPAPAAPKTGSPSAEKQPVVLPAPIVPAPIVPAPTAPPPSIPAKPPTPQPQIPLPAANPPAANPAVDDAAKRAALVQAATTTRLAMSRRDAAGAKQNLAIMAANAQTPADRAEVDRLQTLCDNLEEFWKGVRTAVAKLQPTEELDLGNNRVAIIEASREQLAVMMEGGRKQYRIEALPMPLLWAIVKQSFQPTPGSKIVIGSFLAMDREGNRREARKLWEEAARAGNSLGKDLLPELDIPLPATGPLPRR